VISELFQRSNNPAISAWLLTLQLAIGALLSGGLSGLLGLLLQPANSKTVAAMDRLTNFCITAPRLKLLLRALPSG
jgi:hypothetical protein